MASRLPLVGKVCLVTGGSRGGGRGIALVLGENGATVYVSGRSSRSNKESITNGRLDNETIEHTADLVSSRGGRGIAVLCDHSKEDDVKRLVAQIKQDHGKLDVLINNAWGGYEYEIQMKPFWELPYGMWEKMISSGLQPLMLTSHLVVPELMTAEKSGVIINTLSPITWDLYEGNLFYDVANIAKQRITTGMHHDLKPYSIPVVALAPGWMHTERMGSFDGLTDEDSPVKMESVEYIGRAVVELVKDPEGWSNDWGGTMVEVGNVARRYGFTDIDGKQVPPFTEVRAMD